MLLPREWNRILADEGARVSRYGRPATVVLVELEGLDRMASILGADAADRLLPAVADSISRHARRADHVARLGTGRFGILLPETDEVQAVNFVERIRPACDLWLESGAVSLRLAIGWASATGDAAPPTPSTSRRHGCSPSPIAAPTWRAYQQDMTPGGPARRHEARVGRPAALSPGPGGSRGPASRRCGARRRRPGSR